MSKYLFSDQKKEPEQIHRIKKRAARRRHGV